MPRSNDVVEALLQEYADLLSISGGDPFRVRTYEKAARSVGGYHTDIATLEQKGLQAIPSVGKSIAEKIQEYFDKGSINALEELRAQVPAGVRQLISISTLGPKKAMLLYRDLHIASIEELADAIHEGRLRGVKGFGEKTEENILRGIELMQQSGDRVLLGMAMDLAEEIIAELRSVKGCRKCTYAGSLRRMAETVGDIDILVASNKAEPVMDAFVNLSYVERVIARGETKSSVRTTKGLQVDL